MDTHMFVYMVKLKPNCLMVFNSFSVSKFGKFLASPEKFTQVHLGGFGNEQTIFCCKSYNDIILRTSSITQFCRATDIYVFKQKKRI